MRLVTLLTIFLLSACHLDAQDKTLLARADSLDAQAKTLSHTGKAADAILLGQQAIDIVAAQLGRDNAAGWLLLKGGQL